MRHKTLLIILATALFLAGCAHWPSFDGLVSIRSRSGAGSGAVVGRDHVFYYVATAAHVVLDDPWPLVNASLGETVAIDATLDVAILKVVDVGQDWTVLELADAHQGEPVAAIGWSYIGGPRRMMYRGHVVSETWEGRHHRQASVMNCGGYPGTSGGPILNASGQCVGILRGFAMANQYAPYDSTTIFSPSANIKAIISKL